MRIAFIFAPYNHKKFEENITVVDEQFGCFPPMNLGYATAIAEEAGHEVMLEDANVHKHVMSEPDNMERSLEIVKSFKPDMIAFYLSTYMFQQTLGWIRFFKKHLNVPVIVGGINLDIYPRETLTYKEIDFGMRGEAVRSLPEFLKLYEEKKDYSRVKGLCYRKGGEIIVNPPNTDLVPFDEYPFPPRHLLPNDKYYSFISQRKNFSVILTTMGCVCKCVFCPIARVPFRFRSPENVMREIEECYYKYGVREIDFFDADMPVIKKRIIEICDGIMARNLDLEWSCRARIDSLDKEILAKMSKAGCRQIYVGIEAADDEILKKMKKHLTTNKTIDMIKMIKKHKIRALGFFIIGSPGENKKTVKKTLKFAKALKLDYVQFSRMIAKPNTDLADELEKITGRDYWKNYVLSTEPEKRMPNPWADLTEEEIEKYTKLVYYSFYFRPSYLLKSIFRMRSLLEFRRSVKVGWQMLISYFYKPDTRGAHEEEYSTKGEVKK